MARIVSSGATHRPEETPLAYDGSGTTRWTSGTAMLPTMAVWFEFDIPCIISGIDARAGDDTDNPKSWVVAVLDDPGGHGRREVARGSGPIMATWAPERAQVVRIECTSSDSFYWFSISELTIKAMDIPPVVEPPPEPPITDEEVGPAVFNERLARYWTERWAKKFNWKVGEPCFVTGPGELLVTQSITYPILRNKGNGIFEPWPFTNLEGG